MTTGSDKHPPEFRIELFLLSPGEIPESERRPLEGHLESCTGCREIAERLRATYRELDSRLGSVPTDDDHRLAAQVGGTGKLIPGRRSMARRKDEILDAYAEVVEPTGKWLVRRLIRYAEIHPVKAAGGFSIAALGLVAVFMVFTPSRDVNPAYAKIVDNILSVYNQDAEVLWTKGVFGTWETTSNEHLAGGKKRLVSVADIDGDGISEVMLTGVDPNAQYSDDSLYCFENTGTLRWKQGGGRMIAFGEDRYTETGAWRVLSHFALQVEAEPRPRVYAVFEQKPFWPAKVMELDPADGRTLQEYWHPGHFTADLLFDVDGDGTEEILLGGINNFYERAFLAVLNPRNLSGHGPLPPEYLPDGIAPAAEDDYILFPRTDLSLSIANSMYNSVAEIKNLGPGGFLFFTDECLGGATDIFGGIIYDFGREMVLKNVLASDPFIQGHAKLVSEGRLKLELDDTYFAGLRDSILYWDGRTFSTTRPASRGSVQ